MEKVTNILDLKKHRMEAGKTKLEKQNIQRSNVGKKEEEAMSDSQ